MRKSRMFAFLKKLVLVILLLTIGFATGILYLKAKDLNEKKSQLSTPEHALRKSRVLLEVPAMNEVEETMHKFAKDHGFAIRVSPIRLDQTRSIDLLRHDLELSVSQINAKDVRIGIYKGAIGSYKKIPHKREYLDALIADVEHRLRIIDGLRVVDPIPDRPGDRTGADTKYE